ncbi:NAD(P)H-hydrate dehydratase [Virgibacillus sp. W0181]|uniref:NAD(P)H-hydrate dehydratase n=1 Tax=Virgibacillus sp. W0181 TaxID=3391581 RepID=UPI003F4646EA
MYIYIEEDIRQADKLAKEQGLSLMTLMENAGKGLFGEIKYHIKKSDKILILAGKGNNGGDGIVLARYLSQFGYDVSLVFPVGEPTSEVARQHKVFYKEQGYAVTSFDRNQSYDVIIDCLLGIGTTLPLRKDLAEIIQWSNNHHAIKIAIDLPTGVKADHGETAEAFQADITFCLHGVKPSAFLLPSSDFYGHVNLIDIGLKHSQSSVQMLTKEMVWATFPKRDRSAHKGTYGTGLVIAGSDDMPGSAVLCAIGAIRSGVGKLTMATSRFAASAIVQHVPEATFMMNDLSNLKAEKIDPKTSAIGIGPGLADLDKTRIVLEELLKNTHLPLVIDAGAIMPLRNWGRPNKSIPTILTPHPGEFSRLTGDSVKDIQANRIELARKFAMENEVTIVLKGRNSVIAYPDGEVFINPTGNSGLAKGGSGDVLTGMLVSLLSTHENWREAVANAVYIHGLCAEIWAEQYSEASMTASDYATLLPVVLQKVADGTPRLDTDNFYGSK